MFRYKCKIPVSYTRQGYIYFTSRMFRELSKRQQERLRALCEEVGGEYAKALFEFVTTDLGETAVCMRHSLSRATLYRVVGKYYKAFPKKL